MKYVRFTESRDGRGEKVDSIWGVANEEMMLHTLTGERYGIDVWQVFWSDGTQGRYPGRDLTILGDVPAPDLP